MGGCVRRSVRRSMRAWVRACVRGCVGACVRAWRVKLLLCVWARRQARRDGGRRWRVSVWYGSPPSGMGCSRQPRLACPSRSRTERTPRRNTYSAASYQYVTGLGRAREAAVTHECIGTPAGAASAPEAPRSAPAGGSTPRFRPVRPPRPPAPAGAKPVGPDLCRASTGPNRYTTRRSYRELCPRGLRSRPRAPLATSPLEPM